jgi:hypothetical protein
MPPQCLRESVTQVHQQGPGTDGNHPAQVVQNLSKSKPWRVLAFFAKEVPKLFRLLRIQQTFGRSLQQMMSGDVHKNPNKI